MKKYLLILILAIGAFLFGRFFDRIKKQVAKIEFKPNFGLIFIIAIVCLFLGIWIGKGTNIIKHVSKETKPTELKITLSTKTSGILVLSDFESEPDLKKWKTRKSTFVQSSENKIEGRYSGKAVFLGSVECSNILMENWFEDNPQFGNWNNFNQLKFDIYNPNEDTERLILKIKDEGGRAWQRNMFLVPKQNNEIKIYIAELKEALDISNIRQFNLFVWKPKKEITFYIDNLRLIPVGMEEPQKQTHLNNPTTEDKKFMFGEQNSDFGIGVETSLVKVFLEPDEFKGEATDTIEISLARNEYEPKQLIIYAKKPLKGIKIEVQDLIADINGRELRLDKNNLKFYVVRYVKTKKPSYAVSYIGWWPDPLEEKASFDISEGVVQPIWIEIYTPMDTPAGKYSGNITLKFPDSVSRDIKLKVKVWDFSLPKETHLKTAFDFYSGRLRKLYPQEEKEDTQGYKNRIYELETRYYLDMIKHRIMPVFNFDLQNAFVIKDIKFYLDNGLSAFAIGKYGGSFDNNWPKDQEKLNALISTYRDYGQILKTNSLIDKAYIYTYDEPKYGNPYVDEVTKMIHRANPELKNMVCLHDLANPNNYPGWGEDIDIWCVRNVMFNEKTAKAYKDKGKELWIYVSGPEPPYPTLVIDYPAMAYRIVPWMCWKYSIKGYLYWCVNFWNDNPWENPMNTQWEQNGNGFLYYPGKNGPVPSIRLKVTRDGIEDYEYLYLLAEKIKAFEDRNLGIDKQNLIDKAISLLNIDETIVSSMGDYIKDAQVILKRREEIAKIVEELNKILGEST